jgi:Ca-activated chloride channel family protein
MSIEAPDDVAAGATFDVSWTGEPGSGDYLVVVPKGASTAADAPYVNMSVGAPVTLTAPADPGAYEIWWVEGDTVDDVLARRDITVT